MSTEPNALLREDAIKKLFDEEDLLFFRFLLIEKCGYNLRHQIAHSLMSFQEYNCDYMHLVILALLRLGKYDFTQNIENCPSGGEHEAQNTPYPRTFWRQR